MDNILIGCGQITYLTYSAEGAKWSVPEEQVWAEIAQAGYDGAPLNPIGLGSEEETLAQYRKYGLLPAPGYIGAAYWDLSQRDAILAQVREYARYSQAVGCTELYVAPGGFDFVTPSGKTRREVAGHVGPADGLTDEQYRIFGETLNIVGEITLEYGVKSCFHNHVGAVIETRDEIDRLLALTDPNLLFLGPDTGHLAWAGADPVAFFRDYAPRIKTAHIKDIDGDVRDRGRDAEWPYGTFSANGVFVELGEGCVDFPAIFDILNGVGFSGWLIVETDVTQKPTAYESITVSREYLRSLGY